MKGMANAFAAVLAVGISIFGLAFIAAELDYGVSTEEEDERIFFEKDIGQVGETTTDTRPVEFGSFSVGQTRGDIQVFRRDSAEVSQGRVFSSPLTFEYEADVPEEGEVSFRVVGRDGNGPIYIKVNGEKIFEEPMTRDFTGTPSEFEIEARHLDRGTNEIEIGAGRGSMMSPTTYYLENIQAEINDEAFHDRVETFRMYENEFENLHSVELNFRVPAETARIDAPLEIRANGNTVFEETVARGEYEVELRPEEADLSTGMNTLRFLTFDQASYRLENSILNVHYGVTTGRESVTEEVELSSADLDFVEQEDTSEKLRFQYTNLNNPNDLKIELNDEVYDLNPQTGGNTVEFEEGVLEETNIITFSSNGSFRMENLQLMSERVD